MDSRTRLQVELNEETLSVLDGLMLEIRRSENTRKVGTGTVAQRLLESLSAHPEIINKLLAEYAQKAGGTLKDFHADESGARPFAASRGQKKAAK